MTAIDIDGKVVLVTGGARRVGRAIARGLAREGARVAIHFHGSARDAEEAVRELGGGDPSRAAGFETDLRDGRAAEVLPRRVVERMGRLDVLVNSAAVMLRQPFGAVSPEAWDEVLNLNLRAYFFTAQGAAPALRAGRGKIVNISDVAAFEAWPEYLPHCVSKAGVEMLTRALARVLAPDVTVNAVAPGPVLLPEGWGEDAVRRTLETTPLGRPGSPDDVAAAVTFLLQADYVTGATVVVDGGRLLR